ncbi:hypothetical protein [Actinomycetospora sp. TBRC 11914]|uniref:hypothetical protein n=1 Tax=Actinomycetospora sp. TBRC 11914 TaxID=2729387 RepID=UPI00145CB189|nr:hypothetical protein [Actinomycetospora sp. TBRC 11914]NMO92039.1 hypothetical protein [Actinomycetospora sp. TBRC 11914]
MADEDTGDTGADAGDAGGADGTGPPAGEAELGAAVDDAMADEVKRARARFVQQILGVDRAEGVGRGEEHWNESLRRDAHRDLGQEPPDDAV